MSRTRKGHKSPGWEPWTNIRDKEQLKLNVKPDLCERCSYDEATHEPPVEVSDRYLHVCEACYTALCRWIAKNFI